MPRKRENDPSVTTSGGTLVRTINSAFRNPPAQPISRAATPAQGNEKCASCHNAPNATAAKPIIEPTERLMPPVIMTGVSAMAIKPSSTLNRITSKKLAAEKKFGATTENTTISASRAANSNHSPLGKTRSRHFLCSNCWSKECCTFYRTCFPALRPHSINHNSGQDDPALDGLLPIRVGAQECQGRPNRTHQYYAENRSQDAARASRDRSAAHYNGRDHLDLQTKAGIARNLVKPDGIQRRGEPRQRPQDCEHGKLNTRSRHARQPSRLLVGARRIDGAARWNAAKNPGHGRDQANGDQQHHHGIRCLRQTQPLKIGRKIIDPGALSRPAEPVTKRHHRRESDHDRRNTKVRYQRANHGSQQGADE